MVQEVKRCLRKTLRNARLDYDELHTVLVEIEGTLNSRPLTYVPSHELGEPITPFHLLCGRRIGSIPDGSIGKTNTNKDSDEIRDGVLSRRNYLATLLKHFWNRWSREYVADLRTQHRVKTKPENSMVISTGDVVTVHEDGQPRSQWRLGKVESLILGKDNKIRAAVVKVKSKRGRTTLLKRPVQKLFPLEICHEPETTVQNEPETTVQNDEDNPEVLLRRPRRAAALSADYIRRLVDQY